MGREHWITFELLSKSPDVTRSTVAAARASRRYSFLYPDAPNHADVSPQIINIKAGWVHQKVNKGRTPVNSVQGSAELRGREGDCQEKQV